MQNSGYEMLALFMRYVFVFLMALILLRSLWWLRKDARQFRKELKQLPDAGLVGELVDVHTGKRYPLMREGELGAGRQNDVRLKGSNVPKHALRFLFVSGKGLQVTPVSRHRVFLDGETVRGSGYALHGTQMEIGTAVLRVRLFAGLDVPRRVLYDEDGDKLDGQDEGPNPFEEAQGFVTEQAWAQKEEENPFADFAADTPAQNPIYGAPMQPYEPYTPVQGQMTPPVQHGMYPPAQQNWQEMPLPQQEYPQMPQNMWDPPPQDMYEQLPGNGYDNMGQQMPQQMPTAQEDLWTQPREPVVRHRRSDRHR